MSADLAVEFGERLGADRVVDPAGALPQPALRLDPSPPLRPFEIELAVERLCLDSTSFREIRERGGADPQRMGELIAEIVAARGKLHNPHTDSGGVLLGTVTAVGDRFGSPPEVGERIVTLASLTLTPLRLDRVVSVDPESAQVDVEGTAYLCDTAPWGTLPDDLPVGAALELYDVYGAGSHTRALAPASGTVCVLGAGHAGKLALAAARDAMDGGTVVAVDVDAEAVARVTELGLCDVGVAADLRDPLGAVAALRAAGVQAADLTVVVVNAPGCEPTAILLTADDGTVLFYSMATSFQTAALTADGMSSNVRMLIGNGFAPDSGAYALELARRSPGLREAIGIATGEAS
jgi:L-erythro-3,5-diaminohexanoate dehydrogenase